MTTWPMVRLGEVLQEQKVRIGSFDADGLPLLGVSNSAGLHQTDKLRIADMSRYLRVEVRWFAYNPMRINVGSIGWAESAKLTGIISPDYVVFSCLEHVEPKLVYLFLKSAVGLQAINLETAGSVRERLYFDSLGRIEIPLPPLAEQRRVVARIEELAAQIHEARTLRQQADDEAEAFSYTSLRQIRQRLLVSSHPKSRLGSLTKVTAGGTPSRENPMFWNGEVPWIKTGELIDGDISKAEEQITQDGVENSSAKLFPPETVLIALYGQGQTRGRTGRLLIPATTNQACCAVLPVPEMLESRFIQFWLRSLYVELRAESQGGAQPNWNGAMIKNLEIALPSLAEQRRIVAELDALQAEVDALKRLQAETAAELDALLPSILDRAFKGEL